MKTVHINPHLLVDALNGNRKITKPVGVARDAHGQFYNAFISTDKETDQPVYTDAGNVTLNLRPQRKNG